MVLRTSCCCSSSSSSALAGSLQLQRFVVSRTSSRFAESSWRLHSPFAPGITCNQQSAHVCNCAGLCKPKTQATPDQSDSVGGLLLQSEDPSLPELSSPLHRALTANLKLLTINKPYQTRKLKSRLRIERLSTGTALWHTNLSAGDCQTQRPFVCGSWCWYCAFSVRRVGLSITGSPANVSTGAAVYLLTSVPLLLTLWLNSAMLCGRELLCCLA